MRNPLVPPRSRRSLRLPGFDYRRSGVYFVTLCTHEKENLFGAIVDGKMVPSALGKVVNEEWLHVAKARANVQLDYYVLMPNHLHGLVNIDEIRDQRAGQNGSSEIMKNSTTLTAASLGAIISQFKAAVSRRAWSGLISRDQRIWQRSYYDHIVRSEESLNDIRRYIVENPGRWAEDSLYVE